MTEPYASRDASEIELLFFILHVGCCVSLHPLGGAEHTKKHPFLIHAGRVYATCVLFFFSFHFTY